AGSAVAFGTPLQAHVDFARSRVVLALDADFLDRDAGSLRSARGFAEGRRLRTAEDAMNRLYVVESNYTATGGAADHRLRLPSREIGPYLVALAKKIAEK